MRSEWSLIRSTDFDMLVSLTAAQIVGAVKAVGPLLSSSVCSEWLVLLDKLATQLGGTVGAIDTGHKRPQSGLFDWT
jgi:hypothetical protein